MQKSKDGKYKRNKVRV